MKPAASQGRTHGNLKDGRSADRNAQLTLALQQHAAGDFDQASAMYRRLYLADRRDSEVIFLMGVLCCDLGAFEPAARFLEEALAFTPNFPEARAQWVVALNGWADMHITAGRAPEAKALLDKVLPYVPGDAATLRNLGRVALLQGDAVAAECKLLASLTLAPDHVEALNWLGLARLQLGKYVEAESALRGMLQLRPDISQARNNLGLALQYQGRMHEAQACFAEVLERDPVYDKARINLANTLRILGRYTDAQRELEAVLATRPDAADALNNLSAVFQDQGRPHLALKTLNRALELAPGVPEIRWNLALTQLLLGDFRDGWRNFESRWTGCESLRGGYEMPTQRAWQGESLRGRRLLLWAEQGFGDTLQFVRFAQDAAARGATVVVAAQPELVEILRNVPGVSGVVAKTSTLPSYDYHCPLMSLPYRLELALDMGQLHGGMPYLSAEPQRIEQWRRRMQGPTALKVGLVWAGNARRQSAELAAVDARRSIPLEQLAPLWSVPGCRFFSLQKARPDAERRPLAAMQDFTAEWHDFADTAAVIANLDLVISVDTAVAHLAGGMGRPVWLLNRHDTCWRWLLDRNDSPWYSCLRQFRQPGPGEWQPVIHAVAAALEDLAQTSARG